MENDSILRIIEDTLLAVAETPTPPVLIDLAARLFVQTGFDRDLIGGHVWVPSVVGEDFERRVAVHYDGEVTS